jgi:hypothetical protein
MKMNYTDALTLAINTLSTATDETSQKAVEKLTALRNTYQTRSEKRVPMSDEKKAEISAARKAKTAAARADLCAEVMPILREVITTDMTAKEIYAAAASRLPADMTAPKVQNILLREMAPELVKTEAKGKANTYRLA